MKAKQSAWREFLGLYADGFGFVGGVVAIGTVILWAREFLPWTALLVLGTVSITLIAVWMMGLVFVSHNRPLESIGKWLPNVPSSLIDTKALVHNQPLVGTAAVDSQPAPNLLCLGYDADLYVKLDRHEIFRETNYLDNAVRAIIVVFRNEPNPPRRVGSVRNVSARIRYYTLDNPEYVVQEIDHVCWLDQESPMVSFDVNQRHGLVIGAFHPRAQGYADFFTVYQNSLDSSKKLGQNKYTRCEGFRVIVKLIAGEHGEFGREDEFEIRIKVGENFSVDYLTKVKAKVRPAPEAPIQQNQDDQTTKRTYIEDRFGTDSPMWRWRYGNALEDLSPLDITPYCPECNRRMILLGKALTEQQDDDEADRLCRVEISCRDHQATIYGETGNLSGTDYPEIRAQIQRKLRDGSWKRAL